MSTAFIKGPDVKLFEEELQEYMGVKHVISCANGTDALRIAMMVLGLKPGDEVITTDFTFVATAEAAALLGLKIVFVDPDPGTFNISVDAIRKAITRTNKTHCTCSSLRSVCRYGEQLWISQKNIIFM